MLSLMAFESEVTDPLDFLDVIIFRFLHEAGRMPCNKVRLFYDSFRLCFKVCFLYVTPWLSVNCPLICFYNYLLLSVGVDFIP